MLRTRQPIYVSLLRPRLHPTPSPRSPDRLANQDGILACLTAAELEQIAFPPRHFNNLTESRFLEPPMELLGVVEPLVTPPMEGDVEHLGAGLYELILRPRQPILVAPIAGAAPLDEKV